MIPKELEPKLNAIRADIMEKLAEGPSELANYIAFTLIDNGFDEEDCDKMIKVASLFYKKAQGIGNMTINDLLQGVSALEQATGTLKGLAENVSVLRSGISQLVPKRVSLAERLGMALGKFFPVAIGAGLLGALGTKSLLQRKKEHTQADKAYNEILKEKPELANDPNIGKYYQTIKRFAPSMAADKHILESALEHAHEYGRLDYPVMKELIGMQATIRPQPQPMATTVKSVAGTTKDILGLGLI